MPSPPRSVRQRRVWVVGRGRAVMHVFNNSPLAPCVLAHRPFHANVCACVRNVQDLTADGRGIGAQRAVTPRRSHRESSRRLISDTPLDDLDHIFLLYLLCFHGLLPSSPITPRLLSAPLLLAPTASAASPPFACSFERKTILYESYLFTLLYLCYLKGKHFLVKVNNLGQMQLLLYIKFLFCCHFG